MRAKGNLAGKLHASFSSRNGKAARSYSCAPAISSRRSVITVACPCCRCHLTGATTRLPANRTRTSTVRDNGTRQSADDDAIMVPSALSSRDPGGIRRWYHPLIISVWPRSDLTGQNYSTSSSLFPIQSLLVRVLRSHAVTFAGMISGS